MGGSLFDLSLCLTRVSEEVKLNFMNFKSLLKDNYVTVDKWYAECWCLFFFRIQSCILHDFLFYVPLASP